MSIEREINSHVESGCLKLVYPRVWSDWPIRDLYLSRELFDEVYEEKKSSIEEKMFANLIADLEVFVNSPTVDPAYLRCLEPPKDGIWEIRSTRQYPQLRVFGAFAAKDIFIGTHLKQRDELGSKDSEQWKIEIKHAKSIWNGLFPAYTHKTTTDQNRLFTGALNESYFL